MPDKSECILKGVEALNEHLSSIFGDDLKKYLPIILIVGILVVLYIMKDKKGDGLSIMGMLKDFPISSLLSKVAE